MNRILHTNSFYITKEAPHDLMCGASFITNKMYTCYIKTN